MAELKKTKSRTGNTALIDPVYQKFTRGVLRAISSTEFYTYFMDALSRAENEFQFSNRKMEKAVDLEWVDKIEKALPSIQNIISNPRNIIREEELIVNAANARKAGPDVVRHLSQHASFVEDFNDRTGDVRPSKLMQKYREDSEELYENRLVFTAMEMAYHFVYIRHEALFDAMSDEYGAKLRIQSDMESDTEQVHMEMFLHIKEMESAIDTDERNAETFDRISRMFRLLTVFMNSNFAKQMAKSNRVKGPIYKTNVLKKHPDYRRVAQLLEYLRSYTDVGYSIRVVEQSPEINERFQQDIYHNILFNYMVLKGYLQDDSDRIIPTKPKQKQHTLRPKFIHEIIEELTEDYDLPDVEIRKVLIEELTKEQLMHEEAAERRRLVEEQARRKKEEAEQKRKEKEAQRERDRQQKAAEAERIRQEKEAEKQQQRHEQLLREAEERRRSKAFAKELRRFAEKLPDQLEAREKAAKKKWPEQKDFADAAWRIEAAERRKLAKQGKLSQQEKQLAQQQEKLRREREHNELLARQEEQRRLEMEALQAQIARERELLQPFDLEFQRFMLSLERQKEERTAYQQKLEAEAAHWEQQRRARMAAHKTAP